MADTLFLDFATFIAVVCLVLGIASLFEPGRQVVVAMPIRKGHALDDVMTTRISNSFLPDNERRLVWLKLWLLQAGFDSPRAAQTYYGFKIVLAIVFPLAFSLAAPFLAVPARLNFPLMVGAALLGFLLPTFHASRRRGERQRQALDGFPDMLDLLLVCADAGLGIDTAILKVGEELADTHPVLAGHLQQLTRELRAGRPRTDAMRILADRTGIEPAISLVNLLVQSDALGTSISDTLRAFSEDMRTKRLLRAEEIAQKLGVRLSMVTIGCFLPAIMIAVMTPVMYSVITTLHHVTTGR